MHLSTGLYLCHACGAKGNLYTFFKDLGVPRQEILNNYKLLLDAAKEHLPAAKNPIKAELFDKNPIDHKLLGLLDYVPHDLLRAGFTEQTLQTFDVGFDRWHMRVTYPIRDLGGQLVAISGRTVIDQQPRYKIYTDEYKVWDLPPRESWGKANVLYNAWRCYADLYHRTQGGEIVIVEGFKACMWAHQCGIGNVAALMGDHMSEQHQWIIEDTGATVYLFLDNNDAGWKGCMRAGRALRPSMNVRVILYPERLRQDDKAQPDSLTPEEIQRAKEQSLDFWDFRAKVARGELQ
jgi:DNA primase